MAKKKEFKAVFGPTLGAYQSSAPVAKSGNHAKDIKVTKAVKSKGKK